MVRGLDGPGARLISVSGNDVTRVFNLTSNANVSIKDISIVDARPGTSVSVNGGAISQNGGTLSVTRCEFRECRVIGGTSASGGAIRAINGVLTLESCTFSGNFANAATAAEGGAVHVGDGNLTAVGCLFESNSAQANTVSSGGALTLSFGSSGQIVNCTFVQNSVPSGVSREGGAISAVGEGVVNVEFCTLWSNSAVVGGALRSVQKTVVVRNTLLGENAGGNAAGTVSSGGHNIDNDGTAGFGAGSAGDLIGSPGNKVVRPTEMTMLGNHGGPTMTLALKPGNAAIDAGFATAGIPFDQRGLLRAADGDCDTLAVPDIGAFEYSSGAGLVLQAPDDYVALPAIPDLNTAPALTLEATITPRTLTGVSRILSNTSLFGFGLGFGLSDGRLLYTSYGVQDYYADHEPLAAGVPVHVAVVIDEAHDAYFYVNGSPVDVVAGSTARVPSAGGSVHIGRNPFGARQAFDGIVSDVRIWNVARSGLQIETNYDTELTGSEPGLAGYWRFAETSGNVAFDEAGNADGQLIDQPYRLVQPCSDPCLADVNDSGGVDFDDLLLVLGNFGSAGPAGDADFDDDVDLDDLLIVLGELGTACG